MGLNFTQPLFLLIVPVMLVWVWLVALRRRGNARGIKGKASAVMRSLSVALLALALADTSIGWRGRNTQLIVLADRSQSMQDQRSDQEEMIRRIEEALPSHYSMSVVAFGEDSMIEQSFGGSDFRRFQQQVRDGGTNFEQSLRFASGYFSPDSAKQVLLLTDGLDTQGDADQVTALLSSQGIRVDAHLYSHESKGDAQVTIIQVPGFVYKNEKYQIMVEIDSEVEKRAELLLYSGATLVSSQEVSLQVGSNSFVFQDTAQNTGLVDYRAVLQESGGIVHNNQKSTIAKVMGPPRVLLVESKAGEAAELEKMLEATGIQPETSAVAGMPDMVATIQQYDVMVLVNVDADDCTDQQIDSLDHFVKTLGRGLVVFGGDSSYALGSYIGSDLEKMLPVESNVRNKLDIPSLALIIAVDHSGSMSDTSMGDTRLAYAIESAQRAVEQLTPQDDVGILAFDDTTKWITELQSAKNAAEIIQLIGGIRIGGGTIMAPSLEEAHKALNESDAAIKHMILLTDGEPSDSGFHSIVRQMADDHITVSTVALGRDANVELMEELALLGGGRTYHLDKGDNIPSIFAKETQISTQSYLQDRTFYPEYVMSSPLTSSFLTGMPLLSGFLATDAKPTATVALQSDNRLPILAHWQYGAGQVVAWTSDVKGVWSEAFLSWADSSSFFGGFVANVLKVDDGQGYLELTEENGQGKLSFTVEGMDSTQTEATIITPEGEELQVSMYLERPGVFTGDFPLEEEGVYAVRVEQRDGDEVVNAMEGGLPKGYSAEYDLNRGDRQTVAKLLSASGGQQIDSVEQLFNRPMERAQRSVDLMIPLLLLGLGLFFLDIASRRLQWEARVAAAWRRLVASFSRRRLAAEAAAAEADVQAALAQAEQAQEELLRQQTAAPPPAATPTGAAPPKKKKKQKEQPASAEMSSQLLANRRKRK